MKRLGVFLLPPGLAYGGCARSTSGSQNLAIYWNDTIIFFSFEANKNTIMLKLLWPLLIVNLRIPGLIWRGTAHSIFVPGYTWQTASLETQNASYVFTFYHLIGFSLELLIPCLWIFKAISSKKSYYLILMLFLLTYTDVKTVNFPLPLLNAEWSIEISGAPAVCKAG